MLRTIFTRQILHRQAEVSQDFFHGDAFASSFVIDLSGIALSATVQPR
jgi:hypothetical protein